jgi:hypothetical protein
MNSTFLHAFTLFVRCMIVRAATVTVVLQDRLTLAFERCGLARGFLGFEILADSANWACQHRVLAISIDLGA